MRLLGVDFGLKKVGLALAEDGLPSPLGVIKNDARLLTRIKRSCLDNQIEKIVIGLSEGKMANNIKGFAHKVATLTGLPVEFQDESLTSQEAIVKMIEAGKKRKDRQEREDAFAAAIILQSYLERLKEDV
jgi:putative Holliday junction resolvase